MAWLQTFRLGIVGGELDLVMQALGISFDFRQVEQLQRNVAGDFKRTILKQNVPIIVIQAARMPLVTFKRMMGFYQSKEAMNFLTSDSMGVTDQLEISQTSGVVYLTNTGCTGITIQGVYLRADVYRTGTNYYTGGSFVESTLKITLGTPLPGPNEPVWIDYDFTGNRVLVTRFNPSPHVGASQDYWQANIELTGR